MLKISAENPACQFSYALHPALVADDGAPTSFNIHLVINHLEPDAERTPMVLIVEFDYMRLNGGQDPCPITIELEGLHSGIDLDRIELQFVGHFGDHSFGIEPLEDECASESEQAWNFRRAA